MSLLDNVKTAKRIGHNKLDREIERLIEVARDEMIRAGIKEDKAKDNDDSLINQAVITYCLMELAETNELSDRYEASWTLQCDNLRKSEGYKCTTTSSSSDT